MDFRTNRYLLGFFVLALMATGGSAGSAFADRCELATHQPMERIAGLGRRRRR